MISTRRPVIAGNWKMFKTTAEAKAFVQSLWEKVKGSAQADLPEIVVCPPYTALQTAKETIQQLQAPFIVAAQNMESRDSGAYTGEISPVMLKDLDVRWVVLGHSERRQYFNETDATVTQKTLAALQHGINPIVCVGELLEERESGQTDSVIEQQVRAFAAQLNKEQLEQIIVAYEPVWAIGTGKVCSAEEANRVCKLIRHFLNDYGNGSRVRILYGGSVKADNAQGLLAESDIDGALVGGASLEAESFFPIIQAACPSRV